MGDKPIRTDYMSADEFRRREKEHMKRGDIPIGPRNIPIEVTFDGNYDVFAARVAHGLRHYIVYRSDGGKFARGLVRASDELKEIHDRLRQFATQRTGPVRLRAKLFRRAAAVPTDRWAMFVIFETPDIVDMEGEDIRGSEDTTFESEKRFVDNLLEAASVVTSGSAWNPPNKWGQDRVKRIRDWIWMAKNLPYPANLRLWIYKEEPVRLYFNPNFGVNQRNRMTDPRKGKPPFDGNSGIHGNASPWRRYPFKEAFNDCRNRKNYSSVDDCADHIGQILKESEKEVSSTIANLAKILAGPNFMASMDPVSALTSGKKLLDPQRQDFLDHIKSLLNDNGSLYHTFMKNNQVGDSTFWKY